MQPPAEQLVERLNLSPHPEGGWYRETWRAATDDDRRAAGTAIYYLLEKSQRSRWHRIDATEIWHYYAGAPLRLELSQEGEITKAITLGPDIAAGARPQAIVPALCWQTAISLGAWTLVGCTVSPGFEFDGFELAPQDWTPHR